MNALGITLVWVALQVGILATLGTVLYLLARRTSPAAGAWTAVATLAVAIVATALAFSPWPRITRLAEMTALIEPDDSPAANPAGNDSRTESTELDALGGAAGSASTTADPSGSRSTWRKLWTDLERSARATAAETETSGGWGWPGWLAAGMLLACGLGLARLAAALVAVAEHRRMTRAVSDAAIAGLLAEVQAALGCTRRIELRETAALCSPSTVGWLRPAVVLPGDWREWTAQDRRAVLAHEVSHVAHGDFAATLVAQLGVALHFYNPLFHWLAARLRLEQEMAADCLGADVAGGRKQYLASLAQMALRSNGPALSWMARPFLPVRGTLMRRIEMLHRQSILPNVALSRVRRAATAGALLAAALLLLGVRGPGEAAAPQAEDKNGFTGRNEIEYEPFSLDFVHPDAQFVLAMRPDKLVRVGSVAKFTKVLEAAGAFESLDVPLAELEELKVVTAGKVASATAKQEDLPWRLLVYRASKPQPWKKLIAATIGDYEVVKSDGHEYFKRKQPAHPNSISACWMPDERTVVFAPAGHVESTFALRGPGHRVAFADQWAKVSRDLAAAYMAPLAVQEVAGVATGGPGGPKIEIAGVTKSLLATASVAGDNLQLNATVECTSPEGAKQVAAVVDQAFVKFRADFAQLNKAGPAAAFQASSIPKVMLDLINHSKVEVVENTVRAQTTLTAEVGNQLAGAVAPAHAAAQRAQAANKMKQLEIALLNYHDTYKHFPPAVVMGPDGKTPHSWRVEILPFLEKSDLHKRYKLDEPWDSEHNKALIAEGAELFSSPTGGDSSCAYFLLTGPGTVFDPSQPPCKIRNIVDGTSKTINMVEAKRPIPWSKPEDIEYSPDKPLPKLGGHFEDGFIVGLVDGSVHFAGNKLDETAFRALITRSGREPVDVQATLNGGERP